MFTAFKNWAKKELIGTLLGRSLKNENREGINNSRELFQAQYSSLTVAISTT